MLASIYAKLSSGNGIFDIESLIMNLHKGQYFQFQTVSAFYRLNTNREIYDKLKDVSLNGDIFPMDDLDRHVIELFLCDFEQCGIHLDQRTRANVVQLNDSILRIGQKFSAAALAPRIVPGVCLPDYVRK